MPKSHPERSWAASLPPPPKTSLRHAFIALLVRFSYSAPVHVGKYMALSLDGLQQMKTDLGGVLFEAGVDTADLFSLLDADVNNEISWQATA